MNEAVPNVYDAGCDAVAHHQSTRRQQGAAFAIQVRKAARGRAGLIG
ncbi:hypothetical protein [Paraburkholderia humisilvae]|nr:hypothetical protein [Paraburkholderia humisilvae]